MVPPLGAGRSPTDEFKREQRMTQFILRPRVNRKLREESSSFLFTQNRGQCQDSVVSFLLYLYSVSIYTKLWTVSFYLSRTTIPNSSNLFSIFLTFKDGVPTSKLSIDLLRKSISFLFKSNWLMSTSLSIP